MTDARAQYDFWQRRLSGEVIPIHDGDPQAGFYRLDRKGAEPLAIAYWYDKAGALRCRIGKDDVTEGVAMERWPWASKHPITHDVYKAVIAGDPWPENIYFDASEEWREFDSTGYLVSNKGGVKSPSGNRLIPRSHSNGYLRAQLGSDREEYIHRMVLHAFVGPAPDGHEADHINSKRDDNELPNLRWIPKADNLDRRDCPKGEDHHAAVLTEAHVRLIKSGPFYQGRDGDLAETFGVSRETIRDVRLGKRWSHITVETPQEIGSNNPPEEFLFLKDEIDEYERLANKMLSIGAAPNKETADRASDLANTLGEIAVKVIGLHKVEKAPHLEAGRLVDVKWFTLRDRASDLKRKLKAICVTPFLTKRAAEIRAEQLAAVAAGTPAAELPQQRAVSGSVKRSTGLRTYYSAKITDRAKLLDHLKEHPDVIACIQKIADDAAGKKLKLPGCEIVEDQRAA